MAKSTKVFIMSIPRKTALGLEKMTSDTTGKPLLKTKVGFTRDNICALYSRSVGGLATGLTEPWIDADGNQVKDKDNKPLLLQHKYEQEWNLEPGYLNNRPWRKGDSPKEEDLTYYQKQYWQLNDGSTVLDLSNLEDLLFYHVCLASKLVANSEKEWKQHLWPKAKWYIALENEADEIRYKRTERKSKAFAALHSEHMTSTMKKKFAYLLDMASTKVNLTDEQVHNLLYDFIDNTTYVPGSNLERFMSLYSKMNTAEGRTELEATYLLKQAVDNRIIYEKQGAYNWVRPDGTIELGTTKTEAVDFILNPKKEALVEELEAALNAKNNR